jgi:hypothetical protein
MRILTTINKTKWGLGLGVMHSVFVKDGKVYSFEGRHTLAKRKVVVYDFQDYFEKIHKTISTIEIDDINIEKYIKLEGHMLCHEFITFVYMSEAKVSPFDNMTYITLTKNINTSLKRAMYYMIYLLTVPFVVGVLTYLIVKPNSVEQCLDTFNLEITNYENK